VKIKILNIAKKQYLSAPGRCAIVSSRSNVSKLNSGGALIGSNSEDAPVSDDTLSEEVISRALIGGDSMATVDGIHDNNGAVCESKCPITQ
jgi:hypothetical protein